MYVYQSGKYGYYRYNEKLCQIMILIAFINQLIELLDKSLQVIAMTDEEMAETEGVVAPLVFTPAILGGARVLLTGYTRHGINQAISRNGAGVSGRAILNTMRNSTKVRHDPVRQTTSFHSKGGGVVLNQQGQVVTTWGKPRR